LFFAATYPFFKEPCKNIRIEHLAPAEGLRPRLEPAEYAQPREPPPAAVFPAWQPPPTVA
jgi:hypothetical protein